MRELIAQWKRDKLWGSLCVCWLAAVAASFWGPYLLPITVPLVGTLYLFRVLLPAAAVLYILWAVRERDAFWMDASTLEKWCYLLIAVMLVYGVVSLFRAIDVLHTFRMLFNLCIDLCFFFLMLRLCRNGAMLRCTLWVCGIMCLTQCVMGIYEAFNGGIFNPVYDQYQRFYFFEGICQFPVVTSGNTNDYASMLMFCAAVFLLAAAVRWKDVGGKTQWLIITGTAVIYFLISTSSARLVMAAFFLCFAAFTVFLLISDRQRLWVPLAALILIGGLWFAHQYRYIVPSIQEYIAQFEEYRKQNQTEQPGQSEQTVPPKTPPKLDIKTEPSQSLDEQFFETNEETGEKELRQNSSGGVRVRLLIHAFQCFQESYGLGVGLGNTETLAPQRTVVLGWEDQPQNSIHCFAARIIADFGLFVLIPLCVIALFLLKGLFTLLLTGIHRRDSHTVGFAFLFFGVLCTYPFLSTASSDAQDIIAMWIYLASVVLISQETSQKINMEALS